MPLPDLESCTAMLFSTSDQLLGDTIKVVLPGGQPATVKTHVSHRDKTLVLDFATATAQDIMLELDKSVFPSKPSPTWRILLPRLPGKAFAPREVNTDDSGLRWEFGVREVAVA